MPAARTERNNRKCVGSQRGLQGSSDSALLADAPTAFSPSEKATTEVEEREQPQHGISILKEIFPDHAEGEKGSAGKHRPLQQLLGSLPSPARANLGSSQHGSNANVPFGPPAHAPTIPMAAPAGPPPPPLLPAPGCQAPQEQCEPPRAAAMMHPEQGFTSYRERLRAGGRGAFQRAFDAGFMPKNMKQEWGSAQTTHGGLPQQQDMQHGYGASGESQQMWNGAGQVQNNDYYGAPMQSQYQCMQQQHQQQQQQVQQPQMMQSMMLPQMAVQQPQMVPMPQDIGHTPMNQMQVPQQMPQMPQQPLQLPQMAMSQCQTPTASGASTPTGWPLQQAVYGDLGTPSASGASTPTEMARRECMAVLMPQTSQFFPCDQALLAAQLQASADCQRYED